MSLPWSGHPPVRAGDDDQALNLRRALEQAVGPGVVERLDLSLGFCPAAVPEQHVVGAVGVALRLRVDQVDRCRGDTIAQHVEGVAVEQQIPAQVQKTLDSPGRRFTTLLLSWATG